MNKESNLSSKKYAFHFEKGVTPGAKRRGRPPANGICRMSSSELHARHREKLKREGGSTYTIRIKNPSLVGALKVLCKQRNMRSETAALTCLVENLLFELLERDEMK